MSMLFVTGGGKNKNKRKINHFYFYFVLPKVRVGSPVKHFIKNKRPKGKDVWCKSDLPLHIHFEFDTTPYTL